MINKYSFGIGDRFGHLGSFLLQAFVDANKIGLNISPVWSKTLLEHKIMNTLPDTVRKEADEAIQKLEWKGAYFVGADHITYDNLDLFISASNFFTIDVRNQIGAPLSISEKSEFLRKYQEYIGLLVVPGLDLELIITTDLLLDIADRFYKATCTASRVYKKINAHKNGEYFVVEVSMDEVEFPQSSIEFFFILKMLADHEVPVNVLSLRFSGEFNLGVDFEGDIATFKREFEDKLVVLKYAKEKFGLPSNLKLSIHTGSDKFSLYPIINNLLKKHNSGLHINTQGTTWIYELIGIAQSGIKEFNYIRSIALKAMERCDELVSPYSSVVNINKDALPSIKLIKSWNTDDFVKTIKHHQMKKTYNPHFRQLLHTSYKLASESRDIFIPALQENLEFIGNNVKENLLERHIKPLFL